MIIDLPIEGELLRHGVCSAMPVMNFKNRVFCLTGTFENGKKRDIGDIIIRLGGDVSPFVHPVVLRRLQALVTVPRPKGQSFPLQQDEPDARI